ncbi:MAG: Major Facilitator Superfamily protein [Syntrophus sp. PtaU1.Bin208]|nr:MAG: Major Facilitator Superfamily protein [Syntrophus sp. PtaU1.Bin208]
MKSSPQLFSFEFLALNLILLVAFCSVSVFFNFYHYLGEIGIPVFWRGFLVGLEPMAAFFFRPFAISWITARNAFAVMMASLILLIPVSCSYLPAVGVPALILLRLVHGTVFVLLSTAAVALIVQFIPGEKSGQGFGIVSIATMIPLATLPPLTEAILPFVRSEADIYAGVSLFTVVALLFGLLLRNRLAGMLRTADRAVLQRPRRSEIGENFRQRSVALLLSASFFLYLAHATVFYFTKDLSLQTGVGSVGFFFTISMAMMIAIRGIGGRLFDQFNKLRSFRLGLVALVFCFVLLPFADSRWSFYLIGAFYGLAMGVVLPLLNALLFSASPPSLRGLNTNLTLFALDGGYFLLPYLGGSLIALGAGFETLFYLGAGSALVTLALTLGLKGEDRNGSSRTGRGLFIRR